MRCFRKFKKHILQIRLHNLDIVQNNIPSRYEHSEERIEPLFVIIHGYGNEMVADIDRETSGEAGKTVRVDSRSP